MATPPVPPSYPTPGEAQPGQLLVDPVSRTVWIGVDATVDANRSLLVSAIDYLIDSDTYTFDRSTEYTQSYSAPISHHHDVSDINNFEDEVLDVVGSAPPTGFIKGMIAMWYGNINNVGNGPPSYPYDMTGWALCDGGTHGGVDTPNLNAGKFPVGRNTGTEDIHEPGGTIDTDLKGGGATGSTTLTIAQMPYHSHTPTAAAGIHPTNACFMVLGAPGTAAYGTYTEGTKAWTQGANSYEGGSQGHTHPLTDHKHAITVNKNNVPYVAVVFIMRIV